MVKSFSENGPSKEELKRTKNYIVGKFPRDIETTGTIARQLFLIDFYDLPEDYLTSYRDRVSKMDKGKIKKGLSHLSMNRVVIAVIGEGDKLRNELIKLGPVEVIPHEAPLTPPSMKPVVEIANSFPAKSHHVER